ncbi:glycosyltransferase family 2 protein [Chromobacterium subtsugae]|uniref:glycosyltransferase family 2 protein n=1 Tax=Chromobacterium subtsugae TaxID=251747 RepID=UPI0007F90F3F|nr:glycosyltransferase family 2 protein [Chromobacterium subtsugae]OBU87065.1 hypothetical protein MY55_06035 [Chromobacterium subtsugae]
MKITVLISTYNRPDALDAVLSGFHHQSGMLAGDWEIIVADDGSGPATQAVVKAHQKIFHDRLQHVWHEDLGFRLAEIRNRAALQARGDYLIFLDGDCIPQSDFLFQHAKLAERGWVVAGNRVLMSERFTLSYVSGECRPVSNWTGFSWLAHRLRKNINNFLGWLRLDLPKWRKKRKDSWKLLRGCNIGVWREDYLMVDGFDATFSGWGYEDSDFAVRLIRNGVGIKNGRFAMPVLHLWHKENDRSFEGENWRRFEASIRSEHVKALKGISSLDIDPGWLSNGKSE